MAILVNRARTLHAPRPLLLCLLANLLINAGSFVANTQGENSSGGVALTLLLCFGGFFTVGLVAFTNAGQGRIASRWWFIPFALFVLWTNAQAVGVLIEEGQQLPFHQVHYGSDELYYAQYNAILVMHGQNPYVGDHLADALHTFGITDVTPLRQTPYRDPAHPPSRAALDAIVQQYIAHPSTRPAILDPATVHSYPALSFLLFVPVIFAGLPSITIAQLAVWLALAGTLIWLTPHRSRLFVASLVLLGVDGIRAVGYSDLALWPVAGVAAMWLSRGRPQLAACFMGATCAIQQTAWFFAPFYLIMVMREYGWPQALRTAGIAIGTFLLINLPFVVLSPGPWLHSLFLPMTLPLFPGGVGIIGLSLTGILPLFPSFVYTSLEVFCWLVLLLIYYREYHRFPLAGIVLPLLPLLLAWRSPDRYFILLPLLLLTGVVIHLRTDVHKPAGGDRLSGATAVELP